jgi:hypothetical protein
MVHFKTIPQGLVRRQWYDLAAKLNNVTLRVEKDEPVWKWTTTKQFSVKSIYDH